MASEGPNYPSTAVSDSSNGGTVSWTNGGGGDPTDVGADDGSAATAAGDGLTEYLWATNFGFSIPSGNSIDGVLVEIERKNASTEVTPGDTTTIADNAVRLIKGGSLVGDDKADAGNWASTYETISYGGAADGWGASLADTDVNASNFGVALSADIVEDQTSLGEVDFIRITVTHTTGGGGGGNGAAAIRHYYNFLLGGAA